MSIAACPACTAGPAAEAVAAQAAEPNLFLSLPTIHCAACIRTIENALATKPGINSARVNLSLKRLSVSSPSLQASDLVEVLEGLGFEAHPLDAQVLQQDRDSLGRALLIRMALAGFAMMNVMLLSVAVWSGATDATRDLFHLISAAIALPVVLFSGQPFFTSAWSALKVRRLNMDVPISLAILLAAFMSLYEALNGGAHAYFDAALSLTFFLLIGRFLDHKTRQSARSAAKELSALEVHSARRIMGAGVEEVPVAELAFGDTVLIPTGVRVPVDGMLISAKAVTDRSFLTGEAEPVTLARHGVVQAGEVNLGAPFKLRATAVGQDTTLRRVAALVETAENGRNSYTAMADRAAALYAPLVHLLAFVAFAAWVWVSGDYRLALNVAVAVLIITCPCALGLAVPAVATAAIGRLYAQGFLVKDGTALERLAEIDTVVFDKTGTLTLPGLDVATGALTQTQKTVALALAQASDHPMARAVAESLAGCTPAALTDVEEHLGDGVCGKLDGTPVRLGKGDWIGASGFGLSIGTQTTLLPIRESLRPGARAAVDAFKKRGLDLMLLSGDRAEAVQKIADDLGISDIHAAQSAEEKHALLERLGADGKKVLMIGDGLNDTASLAAAHASIAPSTALDASRSSADIVVLREGFEDLALVLSIAKAMTRLSQQNFAIATGYNLIAVPIALIGLATPLIAALAMSTSSITVLLNAQRVRRSS